jgi:hypothetical protein
VSVSARPHCNRQSSNGSRSSAAPLPRLACHAPGSLRYGALARLAATFGSPARQASNRSLPEHSRVALVPYSQPASPITPSSYRVLTLGYPRSAHDCSRCLVCLKEAPVLSACRGCLQAEDCLAHVVILLVLVPAQVSRPTPAFDSAKVPSGCRRSCTLCKAREGARRPVGVSGRGSGLHGRDGGPLSPGPRIPVYSTC